MRADGLAAVRISACDRSGCDADAGEFPVTAEVAGNSSIFPLDGGKLQPRSADFSIVRSSLAEDVASDSSSDDDDLENWDIDAFMADVLGVGDEASTATAAVINCGGKQKRAVWSQPTHVVVDSATPHKFSDQLLNPGPLISPGTSSSFSTPERPPSSSCSISPPTGPFAKQSPLLTCPPNPWPASLFRLLRWLRHPPFPFPFPFH